MAEMPTSGASATAASWGRVNRCPGAVQYSTGTARPRSSAPYTGRAPDARIASPWSASCSPNRPAVMPPTSSSARATAAPPSRNDASPWAPA